MGRLAREKVAGELRETLWRINAWPGTDLGRPSRRAAPGTSTWTVTQRPSPIPDTFAFVQMFVFSGVEGWGIREDFRPYWTARKGPRWSCDHQPRISVALVWR